MKNRSLTQEFSLFGKNILFFDKKISKLFGSIKNSPFICISNFDK
jgi:hypothetical protein